MRECGNNPRRFGEPSAEEVRGIAAIAHAEAGIVIAPDKASMIQSRLAKRLRSLGLQDFTSYIDLVGRKDGGEERRRMISQLTTNVSHFFREPHHFDLLRSAVLPPLLARLRSGGRVRIWSAGCSNGQEPYSIAMTVLDMAPDAAKADLRILATDVDSEVVASARAAAFEEAALKPISPELRAKFFEQTEAGHRLTEPIRNFVRFQELNLHAVWPMKGRFDVIFCRNVVIYFDPAAQARLWERFASVLEPDGWLFVGHSERVPLDKDLGFKTAGITAYRLNGAGT